MNTRAKTHSSDSQRRSERRSSSASGAGSPPSDSDDPAGGASASGEQIPDPGTDAFSEYIEGLEQGTDEYRRALRIQAKAHHNGNGSPTSEQYQKLERAHAEEQQRRQSAEFKIKQANSKLRDHGLSVEDLADGDIDPSKLNKLNIEPTNHPQLEWQDFPLGTLPDAVRRYAKAHSEAMCVDPAMIAVPSLSVMASAIGNSRRVQIKSNWIEPPTVWTCLISPSGALKSPSMEKALSPAYAEERRLKDEWEHKVKRWEEKPEDERDSKPSRDRRLANDATVESVALLHDDNPRGLLLYRDELAGWLGSFNQYNRGDSDLQKWIELYESRPIQIDRKSSDRPAIYVEDPAVSVTGTIQPDVLEDRLESLHFQSGFAARLLMCEPPERPRRFNDAGVTDEARKSYRDLVSSLYEMDTPAQGESEGSAPHELKMGGTAREVYGEFFDDNQRLLEKLQSGPLRAVVAKIEAVAARFALIFQLAESPTSEEIERDAMIAGTTLARWFRQEVARIYQLHGFDERGVSRDRRLAKRLPTGCFGVDEIEKVWDVSQRGAYKVRDRLIKQGLLVKENHGEYRSLAAEGELNPFEHFAK
jgi:hypothetical protein